MCSDMWLHTISEASASSIKTAASMPYVHALIQDDACRGDLNLEAGKAWADAADVPGLSMETLT